MDIYKKPLQKDELILMYLKEKLNHNIDLSKIILTIKNNKENKETMDYYINRWENIAGSHYILHDTHCDKFSYIFNDKEYVVKPDHNFIFYKLTGISYQIVELIHELIKINKHNTETLFIWNHKYWLNKDDKLYCLLSKKIAEKMKSM